MYKQRDIVLIKFPFTDLSSYKLRPALIISNSSFNKADNVLLIGIYWNKWIKNYSIEIINEHLSVWKLKKNIYKISKYIFYS